MLSFSFLSFTSVHKKREICSKEKELLTVVLKELRKCLLHKSHDSTNPSFALCSLTLNIIKQLVDNAEYIFTRQDVGKIITDEYTNKEVFDVFAEVFDDIPYVSVE